MSDRTDCASRPQASLEPGGEGEDAPRISASQGGPGDLGKGQIQFSPTTLGCYQGVLWVTPSGRSFALGRIDPKGCFAPSHPALDRWEGHTWGYQLSNKIAAVIRALEAA